MTADYRLLVEALITIRGSDPWPGISSVEMGTPVSSGRYKSAVAKKALEDSRSLTEPRTDGHGDRDDAPAREPSNPYDLSKPYRDTYPYGEDQ